MTTMIFQAIFILLLPALVLFLEKRFKAIEWISAVLVCYLAGMGLANLPLLEMQDALSLEISAAMVALAIPLLLISVDIVGWLRLAKTTVLSFFLCVVSVLVLNVSAFFLFGHTVDNAAALSGMLIGVYTGGTPNMAAIGTALGVDAEMFMMVNAADIMTAAILLPFLFTVAGRVYGLFLPPFPKKPSEKADDENIHVSDAEQTKPFSARYVLLNLLLAGVIVSIAWIIGQLAPKTFQDALIILVITTLAVLLSLSPKLRSLPTTSETGHYLLLVFCVAIGTTAQWEKFAGAQMIIVAYVAYVMFGSVILHALLSRLAKIDKDTVIITATASVFGPAFIGPVAVALKNKEVVVSGIATSLVGFAVGNYLGLTLAWVLS